MAQGVRRDPDGQPGLGGRSANDGPGLLTPEPAATDAQEQRAAPYGSHVLAIEPGGRTASR